MKTSIIIPSRNERYLFKTINEILQKATGDIEIIPVLDGYWCPSEEVVRDPRVKYLHFGVSKGMRNGINSAVAMSTGEYLLKLDGHCMLAEGMDEVLKKDCDEDWIVIPRRKRLDAEAWQVQDVGKPDVDYEYIGSPNDNGVKGQVWTQRALERSNPKFNIDENMTFQGSCWFMTRKHWDRLGDMQEEGYGTFVREAQELCLKTWLGGGKVMTNKNTWYAHLHKGPKHGRGYFLNKKEMDAGNKYCDDFWSNNRWKKAKYDLAWLIERFGGIKVPTWTEELIEQVRKK